MILDCPHCAARLEVPSPPTAEAPIRCPACGAVIGEPVAIAEAVPEPDEEPPLAAPVAEAVSDESDDPWDSTDDEPAKPSKRKAKKPEKKPFPVALAVGAALAVVAVGGLVYMLLPPSKPAVVASVEPEPKPREKQPKTKDGNPPGTPPKKQIPPEFAELFAENAESRPAPTVPVPVLQKVGREELAVTPVKPNAAVTPDAGKMTLEEVKKSTVYLRVIAGTSGGTGSGFVIRAERDGMLIATNQHVISPKGAGIGATPAVSVIFDSGLPTERTVRGEVVASDAEIDLAIVRVAAAAEMPKPIDPGFTQKLMETMEVRVCGFPFGGQLGVAGRNPNITIGKGAVSSVRLDAAGNVSVVQIDGALNPGNSGGPVVDVDGRLVGVAVSTIKGSGIGMAIPAAELSALLAGRVSPPVLLSSGSDGGEAAFRLLSLVTDPLRKVKGVTLHVWTGDEPPTVQKEPGGTWKVIPGAAKVELAIGGQMATGEFRLAAPAGAARLPLAVLQLECRYDGGVTLVSPPVVHRLVLNAVQTAADAIPMETFKKDLAKFAGQVVVVRGKLAPGSRRHGAVYELNVSDDSDSTPAGLTFVADREVATQLNELPSEEQSLPVRLTLRVAKAATAGTTAVRVAKLDFIGRGNRLVKSIPSAEPPDDPLVALNRAPEKFVGQTVTFTTLLSAAPLGTEKDPELSVLLMSERQPENLHFAATPAMAKQLKDPTLEPFLIARIAVRVENKELDGSGPRVVTVLKIEVLDREGKARKTIE